MIDLRSIEITIVENLKKYLSEEFRPCEVIRQNQVAHIPPYPYVSYTVTTPIDALKGTYCKAEDGTLYRNIQQIWSFTVQSNDYDESLQLGLKMMDYFTAVGLLNLSDKNITVRRVTNLTSRDNLITIQYEYRHGLDVTFGLLYTITPDEQINTDVIESNTFKEV